MNRALRDEALLLLQKRGDILQTAREVTHVLRAEELEGAVIGGVAVVLHGYVRTTMDVDVFVSSNLQHVAAALQKHGFSYHRARREFRRHGVPVHLVTSDQTRTVPAETVEIDDVRTVSLADLIAMKLSSGTRDLLRVIDLADVIGLIGARRLTPAFAGKLPRPLRPDFRKLARMVAQRQ
jgi:hypothetical protein